LTELAAVKLRPGALCLAYCGQYHLPAVLEAMAQRLTYHWTFAIRFGGPHRAVYAKKIANTWHPLVRFSRGKATAGWIVDMLESGGKEKDSHDWRKTLTDAEYIIDKLTVPGALVVDPFCGSGTVPAACKRLGRRWLACEVDSGTAKTARRRLAASTRIQPLPSCLQVLSDGGRKQPRQGPWLRFWRVPPIDLPLTDLQAAMMP
jgi:hypothetical protein